MKVFILLFGLLAALLGFLGSTVALGLQLQAVVAGTRNGIDTLVFAALGLSVLGLYGATLALRHPRLCSTVLATAAVGGLLSLAWFYVIPALLFSIASTLSFLWRNEAAPSLRNS
jgi:hypothetical protein